jgi:hypothetical protein
MMSRSAQKRERGVGPAGSEDVGQAGRRSGQGLCEGAGAVGVAGRGEFAFRPLLLSYHGLDRQVGDLWDCVMRTGGGTFGARSRRCWPAAGASGSSVRMTLANTLVAEARIVEEAPAPVQPVSMARAHHGMARYACLGFHPFPNCFTCGPAREEGDGLRIFPGPVSEGVVASVWIPHPSLTDELGTIPQPIVWAALDCPGGWSAITKDRPMVPARMTTWVESVPTVGEPHIVVGSCVGTTAESPTSPPRSSTPTAKCWRRPSKCGSRSTPISSTGCSRPTASLPSRRQVGARRRTLSLGSPDRLPDVRHVPRRSTHPDAPAAEIAM